MIGVNKVILVGRVASDVECKTTRNGRNLTRFSVAIPRRNAQGEPAVDFFSITTWDRTAETCGKYVKKGEKIFLEGYLRKSVWETDQGEKRSRVEIHTSFVNFLGSNGSPKDSQDEDPRPGFAVAPLGETR
jgi:single-strand DNA-binding protein